MQARIFFDTVGGHRSGGCRRGETPESAGMQQKRRAQREYRQRAAEAGSTGEGQRREAERAKKGGPEGEGGQVVRDEGPNTNWGGLTMG